MTMKTRVARAICKEVGKDCKGRRMATCDELCAECLREAGAAMGAMRNPTENMCHDDCATDPPSHDYFLSPKAAGEVYEAMIARAINEDAEHYK